MLEALKDEAPVGAGEFLAETIAPEGVRRPVAAAGTAPVHAADRAVLGSRRREQDPGRRRPGGPGGRQAAP